MRNLWRVAATLILSTTLGLAAQDREWVRMWESAQKQRPASLGPSGRIAPPTEPGTPMTIHGRVFAADGKTALPGVTVFAYQTDRGGVYNREGATGWRLRGWAKSDGAGRFELQTIRPGPYPANRIASHVHLTIEGSGLPRRWAPELRFLDDPYVRESEKAESRAAGLFGAVRPVTTKGGVQHVDFNIRVEEEGRF